MQQAWLRLIELGVPDGAIRRPGSTPIDPMEARSLVQQVIEASLDLRRAELLLAWMRAWQHHWSDSFEAAFGDFGPQAVARLSSMEVDPNRYLKFRRLAISNLSHRL
jgi:hypothetical protein